LEFIQDSIVYLYGTGQKLVKHEFRLIQATRKSDKISFYLLTNLVQTPDEKTAVLPKNDVNTTNNQVNTVNIPENEEASLIFTTQQIAAIYKSRWDIEVLFKFLKQEMNLEHFVCNDINAIQIMIYCTLIVSMLLLVYKKINAIKSYKIAKMRFTDELRTGIILDILSDEENIPHFKEMLKKISPTPITGFRVSG
jgi:hypothetical protein